MTQFTIKITGEGSKDSIVQTLENVLKDLKATPVDILDGVKWESATLFTEINTVEDEVERMYDQLINPDKYC